MYVRKSFNHLKIFFCVDTGDVVHDMYSLIHANKGEFSTSFPEKEVPFQHKYRYG